MPADFEIVQGDTEPVFADKLTYENGEAADLEGASVTLMVRSLTQTAPVSLTGEVTISNPAEGAVIYAPSTADSATAGTFLGNWRVVFADGGEMTFPTKGYLSIEVQPNLASLKQQLVGLLELKEHLGIASNNYTRDDELTRLIEAVRPLIEKRTGPIIPQKFDEWHDGGNTWIMPRRRPATSLGTTPVMQLVACSEYLGPIEWPLAIIASPDKAELYSCMLDPQMWRVVRMTAGGGVQPFPYHPQAVHVVYEAGQAEVPANVRFAVLEAIREWWDSTQQTGRGARTLADSEEAGPSRSLAYGIARHAIELIAPLRRHPSLA